MTSGERDTWIAVVKDGSLTTTTNKPTAPGQRVACQRMGQSVNSQAPGTSSSPEYSLPT